MIRSVYILGEQGNIVYSKDYAKGESEESLIEFLVNLTQFLKTVELEDKTEFMNLSTQRFFYAVRSNYTFVFVADKADDSSQIEEKMEQLVDIFIKEYSELPDIASQMDGFGAKVDEIAVTMVKVAILGYAGVGKTTTLHLLRGETLPLVHDPTIGVSIKKLPEE
ncbi:MAG: hypothetical protein ACXAEN_13400, partial [Candidatus Thorarchaeota archaeon]